LNFGCPVVAQRRHGITDPTPLTLGQTAALLAVAARELLWILPAVAREVGRWRERALAMPAGPLRDDALLTLERERLNAEGAALFTTLPRSRNERLLRLLVAYQIAFDYLDTISERDADDPLSNGRCLHRALVEALEPGCPPSDYYRHHPWRDDGGYLCSLVQACQRECASLPRYRLVRALVIRHGERFAVQSENHGPDPSRRRAAIVTWAEHEAGEDVGDATPVELAAAASSSLLTHALLALAAEPDAAEAEAQAVCNAYFPWITAASTFLDSFVDQADDAATGNHSYIAHYPSPEAARERLCEIVHESARRARALRRGTRHALIATGMVSMYLSKDSAREPALRDDARAILAAAGSLPRVQLPIMRVMRRLHGLRSA
jgi:tetraprenyl-beta-curcumene synthase